VEIGALEPGPKYVTFVGRIVNFYDLAKAGKRPQSAKGCLKLMVGDDTGAVTVSLTLLHICNTLISFARRYDCGTLTFVMKSDWANS
jgi:hypothetical protein